MHISILAGAEPPTPLGEFTALHQTPSWWVNGLLPQELPHSPFSRSSGPRSLALRASTPLLSVTHFSFQTLACLLFVTRRYCVKMTKYNQIFSPSGSHIILVFRHQTVWQYSDRDPLTGASNTRDMKNRDFRLALLRK